MRYEMLKELCEEKGVSVSRCERECGFAKGSLSKIDRHRPSYDKLVTLSEYFGMDMFALLMGSESERTPIYDVAAGEGRINESFEQAPAPGEDHRYVRICGESMAPVLMDGDIVEVDTSVPDLKKIRLAVVKVNGDEVTVKNVEIAKDGVWLRAENKAVYEDRFYTMREVMTLPVTIIGRAVRIVSREL